MAEPENPYATPASRVADLSESGPAQPRLIRDGRTVPAGNGWAWLTSGWDLFRRNPGVWILIVIIFAAIQVVFSALPIVGIVAFYILTPLLVGGIMSGCAALECGEALEVSHLFAGFRERTGSLVQVGLLYFAGVVAIGLLLGAFFGFGLVAGALTGRLPVAAMATLGLVFLLFFALVVPLLMAIWFAPALVMLHDLKPIDALKSSFAGCLKNIPEFLIYGVVGLVLAIVATIPALLGWLILGPVTIASAYTGYRDIFTEPIV
jgi:uncharacterized membrane protein